MNSTNFDIFRTSDNTHSAIKPINIPIKQQGVVLNWGQLLSMNSDSASWSFIINT